MSSSQTEPNHAPRELNFSVRGMNFAAQAWGDSQAPVLLALHGWMDNAATFTRLAPLLRNVQVIALDMAGHGHSDHRGVGADYPIWNNIPDIIAVADQLGLERIHLLGHSMGAIISSAMAATLPERVASLSLIDGFWPVPSSDDVITQMSKALAHRCRPDNCRKSRFASIDMAVKARRLGFGKISAEAAEILVRRGLQQDEDGWFWRSDARLMAPTMVRLTEAQSQQLIAAIKAPALLVAAEDGLLAGALDKHRQSLHHIDIHRLAGDHHLHLEQQAGQVAGLIQTHLDRVLGLPAGDRQRDRQG